MEADKLRELIKKRIGVDPEDIMCPREKTFMTPCVVREGDLTMADDKTCVGCGINVLYLLEQEKGREKE